MTSQEFNRLKKRVEELRRQRDRSEGSLEAVKAELLRDFGCKSLEEGKKLLAKLKQEEAKAEEAWREALEAFEKKWSDRLEGL